MSQNFAAQTANAAAGGVRFTNLDSNGNLFVSAGNQEYEAIAASQTKQPLGATGAIGNTLSTITIVPATTSPGAVTLYDGSGSTGIVVFTGGATSVADLKPFQIAVNARAVTATNPGWFVTTGTNVSVLVVGDFT